MIKAVITGRKNNGDITESFFSYFLLGFDDWSYMDFEGEESGLN